MILHRRRLLTATAGLAGTALLGGCDRFAGTDAGRHTLRVGEDANLYVQRLLMSPQTLAREFPESMISPWFKPNGSIDPPDTAYKALAAKNFSDFKLKVDGLVDTPLSLSLADLRALPARTQITRHDCVEGWSCIGQWSGVPLAEVLKKAGLKPQARFAVFHCADTLEFEAGEDGFVAKVKLERMELGEPDASGRRRPVEIPGSEYEIEVDTVIMSLGTSPNPLISSTTKGLETNKRKCIIAEAENGQTTRQGVFAGGDAVTGAATVILAMEAWKHGAQGIHAWLSAIKR